MDKLTGKLLQEFKLTQRLTERTPKSTDTPAIGDELVVDGKKFTLVKIVSAGDRDPEGYRIYVFKAEDGEEIQVPMQGNKLA